jgi:hypothetical protein
MATLSKALKLIEANIKAQKSGFSPANMTAISGKPGIGKTRRIEALAKKLNMSFYPVSVGELSIEQLSGLPTEVKVDKKYNEFHKNADKKFSLATEWSSPEIIQTANTMALNNTNGVILFLDDIHLVNVGIESYLFQLIQEKSIGDYKLSQNVFLVSALNDSESANFDGLPSPVINRTSFIEVDFDVQEFVNDYSPTRFEYQIQSFIKQNSNFVNETESNVGAFGTPRSWEALNQQFSYLYNQGGDDKNFVVDEIGMIAKGAISNGAALELSKHIAQVEALRLDKYVFDKNVIDISKKNSTEQVLFSYLTNFTHSVSDLSYLADMLNKNIENSNFVSAVSRNIYSSYVRGIEDEDFLPSKSVLGFTALAMLHFSDEKTTVSALSDEIQNLSDRVKFTKTELTALSKVIVDDAVLNDFLSSLGDVLS